MRASGEGVGSIKMRVTEVDPWPRPSLFVRPLEQGETEFLAHLRKSRRQSLRQRAQILMASMVYTPVYQIALICKTDEAHVRRVIHAFNDFGLERLNPKVGTGRPR